MTENKDTDEKRTNYGELRLGLCCINTLLRKKGVFCSRTCIRSTYSVEKAKKLAAQNVKDIAALIEWNERHNIKCLRLSSDMFPHFTDDETEPYDIDFARDTLRIAGDLAKRYGHRIVFHPGQYNQVGAKSDDVLSKTIRDLGHHADILDAMGIDDEGVMIVHGGGLYGDREKTMKRWVEQFKSLPEKIRRRLVIENCERNYNTDDCLLISSQTGIPVVFDFHHYYCWSQIYGDKSQRGIEQVLPDVIKTWGKRRPLMHISEQDETKRIGAHSDYIETIPEVLFRLVRSGVSIDLEIEAKQKEQAILRLYDKYESLRRHQVPDEKRKIPILLKSQK